MPRSDHNSDAECLTSLNSDEPDYEAMAEARPRLRGDYEAADERAYERHMTGH